MRKNVTFLIFLVIVQLVCACVPVALTAGGVGGGAASHQMGGLVYRTFTEPLPRVRSATLAAFKRMAIKPERTVKVELEALTSNTTRMRATVRRSGGMVVASATAVEIITQTEQAINHK